MNIRLATPMIWLVRLLGALIAFVVASPAWADKCQLSSYGTLPVEMVGDRATATVKINGQDSRFILDTGAFFGTMSRATAEALGLKLDPAPEGFFMEGIGGTVRPDVTWVRDFEILGATLHKIEFVVGGSDMGEGINRCQSAEFGRPRHRSRARQIESYARKRL